MLSRTLFDLYNFYLSLLQQANPRMNNITTICRASESKRANPESEDKDGSLAGMPDESELN
jgi:hypothetical protein